MLERWDYRQVKLTLHGPQPGLLGQSSEGPGEVTTGYGCQQTQGSHLQVQDYKINKYLCLISSIS